MLTLEMSFNSYVPMLKGQKSFRKNVYANQDFDMKQGIQLSVCHYLSPFGVLFWLSKGTFFELYLFISTQHILHPQLFHFFILFIYFFFSYFLSRLSVYVMSTEQVSLCFQKEYLIQGHAGLHSCRQMVNQTVTNQGVHGRVALQGVLVLLFQSS